MLRNRVLSTFAVNGVQLALGIATSILVARWLGPAGRGEVAAALLWPTLLIYAGSLGLFHSAIYLIGRAESQPGRITITGLLLGLLHGCIVATIGLMIIPLLLRRQSPEVIFAAKLLILIVPLSMIGMCGTNLLLGRMYIHTVNWMRCVVPIGYLVGVIALQLTNRLSVVNLASLLLVLNLLFVGVSLWGVWRCGLFEGMKPDLAVAKQYWSYGAKIHVGSMGALANQNLVQMILATYAMPAQLGIFVVAANSAGVVQMLSQAVQTVALPTITRGRDDAERAATLQHIFGRLWNANLFICPVVALLLPPAMLLAYGWQFVGAIAPAEILLINFVLLGARDVLVAGTQGLGRPLLGSGVYWLGAVVTALLLILLMPRWGIVGAAIASTVSAAVQVIATIVGLRNFKEFHARALFRIDFSAAKGFLGDVLSRARLAMR